MIQKALNENLIVKYLNKLGLNVKETDNILHLNLYNSSDKIVENIEIKSLHIQTLENNKLLYSFNIKFNNVFLDSLGEIKMSFIYTNGNFEQTFDSSDLLDLKSYAYNNYGSLICHIQDIHEYLGSIHLYGNNYVYRGKPISASISSVKDGVSQNNRILGKITLSVELKENVYVEIEVINSILTLNLKENIKKLIDSYIDSFENPAPHMQFYNSKDIQVLFHNAVGNSDRITAFHNNQSFVIKALENTEINGYLFNKGIDYTFTTLDNKIISCSISAP